MGKPTGFIEIQRKKPADTSNRRAHSGSARVYLPYPAGELEKQGARCMDRDPVLSSGLPAR